MTANILLVQAEGPERTRLEDALSTLSANGTPPVVVTASTGRDAVRRAGEQPFDLVVADLVLPRPGLCGAETLIRVGELLPDTRTLLFSDHAYVRDLLSEVPDLFLPRGDDESFFDELVRAAVRLLESCGKGIQSLSQVSTLGGDGENLTDAPRARRIAGKYQLGEEIGRGGMGVVCRAEDTFIGRPVAVKLLRVRATADRAGLTRRMRREVMIAGRLDHPNIVTIHDAGFDGDEMYFVMELIEGHTLRQRLIERGALGRDEALGLLRQTLDAVSYAHARQVVHRDLKPENILLTHDGRVKVVDFGVAKIVSLASSSDGSSDDEGAHRTTSLGAVIGTKGYMAPEQRLGEPVDHRADLYALGVVLYEMLHGRPFQGRQLTGNRATRADTPRKLGRRPEVSGDARLADVVRRATALLPDERFQTGEAFRAAVEEAVRPPFWKRWLPWP